MNIKRVQIEEGFLDGLDVAFALGLNAIIGERGTGKTSLIELIRILSITSSPNFHFASSKSANRIVGHEFQAQFHTGHVVRSSASGMSDGSKRDIAVMLNGQGRAIRHRSDSGRIVYSAVRSYKSDVDLK